MAANAPFVDDGVPAVPPSAPNDLSDLGFGRVLAQGVRGRFLAPDGTPTSRKYGLGPQRVERFYLRALTVPWPAFLAWTAGAMLLANGCFALAYAALGSGALGGTASLGLDDPFQRALAFSVGVFTTVGTGPVHPVGSAAHWLVILESLAGPLALIFVAGLLIARLVRPRLRLRFSEAAVVAPYAVSPGVEGRGLMFRLVNAQPSELSDVQVRVNLARFEEVGGVRQRRFYQLTLERPSVEFFTLHWTVVHPITTDSPLVGVTPERLQAEEAEFLILVNAHEETFSTRVAARTSYLWDEVRWDVRFASVFSGGTGGVLAIDVERLDRTEPLPEGTTTRPGTLEGGAVPTGPVARAA